MVTEPSTVPVLSDISPGRRLGVSPTRVLLTLVATGRLSLRELATATGLHPSTVHYWLPKLRARRLIDWSPGRAVTLHPLVRVEPVATACARCQRLFDACSCYDGAFANAPAERSGGGSMMNDPIDLGFDATRVRSPASDQDARYRAERVERARRNLALTALERHPGDGDEQARWLGEVLDILGLRESVRANPKTASGFCARCGAPRPVYHNALTRQCQRCAQRTRRDREVAGG